MSTATETPPAPPAEAPALTMDLLRDFAQKRGCDKYSADSKKIELLGIYFWVRQLAPGLDFETFLERFEPLADYDAENLKHPDDAIKKICPRSKKVAEAEGVDQWTAKQVVDITVLYVDVIREAERTGQEVPLTLNEFLEALGPDYLKGEIPPPDRTNAPRGASARSTKKDEPTPTDPDTGITEGLPIRPSASGQRAIYEMPGTNGRQIKGVVEQVHTEGERQYVDFQTDDGERIEGANILHFVIVDEASPQGPSPDQVVERKRHWIPKAQYESIKAALDLAMPMGNVNVGEAIDAMTIEYDCGLAVDVQVMNGSPKPYVDAQLVNPAMDDDSAVIAEIDPRENILGDYRFETADGVYILEVATRA